MGIPYYFRSIMTAHADVLQHVRELHEPVDLFCLDYNCAIHGFLRDEDPVGSVIAGTRELLALFRLPPAKVYIAIDGVVPMAKQVQQRNRRFQSQPSAGFDRNQISPGTPFMQQLEKALALAFPSALLSPSSEPGEGEHKIMKLVKQLSSEKKAVIYGLDADLILLSMQPACQTYLLRELTQFGVRSVQYGMLNVKLLQQKLGMPATPYMMLSMCFGNDFLPPIPVFSLRNNGFQRLQRAWDSWKAGSKSAKKDPLPFMLDFFKRVAPMEPKWLQDIQYHRRHSTGPEALGEPYIARERSLRFHRPGWRFRYYAQAFNVDASDEDQIRQICLCYWRALEWVSDYYVSHTDCLSWQHYYPFADAPLLEDLVKHHRESSTWSCTGPSSVAEQLRFILPAHSWKVCGLEGAPKEALQMAGLEGSLFRNFVWECKPKWSEVVVGCDAQ